jgi:hypothetical protein
MKNFIKHIINRIRRKPLLGKPVVSSLLPTTETQLKNMMFSAYLTGQTDILNKQRGLEGQSFSNWYMNNYEDRIQ